MTEGGCAGYIQENHELISEVAPELTADYYIQSSESMQQLDDRSVQLVVTSPPYPMIEMWEEEFGEYETIHNMIENVIQECWRILDHGCYLCINIGDAVRSLDRFQYYPNHAEILMYASEIGFDTLVPIHWMKPTNKPNSFLGSGFAPPNAYITLDTEYILIFRKGDNREFDANTLRNASHFTKEQRDVWFSQQWKVAGETQDGYAVFPREIPYRLIRMFSVLGDTVVDPFCGTGTTLEVGRALGRRVAGYEVNDELEPHIQDKLSNVDEIGWHDILSNYVQHEQQRNFGVDEFVRNSNTLVDFI